MWVVTTHATTTLFVQDCCKTLCPRKKWFTWDKYKSLGLWCRNEVCIKNQQFTSVDWPQNHLKFHCFCSLLVFWYTGTHPLRMLVSPVLFELLPCLLFLNNSKDRWLCSFQSRKNANELYRTSDLHLVAPWHVITACQTQYFL